MGAAAVAVCGLRERVPHGQRHDDRQECGQHRYVVSHPPLLFADVHTLRLTVRGGGGCHSAPCRSRRVWYVEANRACVSVHDTPPQDNTVPSPVSLAKAPSSSSLSITGTEYTAIRAAVRLNALAAVRMALSLTASESQKVRMSQSRMATKLSEVAAT